MVGAALNRTFGQWRLFISSKVFLLFYDFFSPGNCFCFVNSFFFLETEKESFLFIYHEILKKLILISTISLS